MECARSRPTVACSDLAGWAGYGYRASRSRCFWGLRLHMVTAPDGHALLTDKGYRSKGLETELDQWGVALVRPAARGPRPGKAVLGPLRQRIESVNDPSRTSWTRSATKAAPQPA